MEGSPERDKRKGKAKVEEADQEFLLPKPTLNRNSNMDDECYYLKLVGQLRIKDAVGPDSLENVTRNLFRVRNKDIPSILGDRDEILKNVHSASGATIGISYDRAARLHRHAYLELLGTVDEVKIAELLIVDAITEMYEKPFVPTALMPISICHHGMSIPLSKVPPLLGISGNNLVKMEVQSGAWIELDTFEVPSAWKPWTRGVSIYGDASQVTNAMNMINKIVSEEAVKPEERVQDSLAEEITSTEDNTEHQESANKFEDENKQHGSVEETAHNDSDCIEDTHVFAEEAHSPNFDTSSI